MFFLSSFLSFLYSIALQCKKVFKQNKNSYFSLQSKKSRQVQIIKEVSFKNLFYYLFKNQTISNAFLISSILSNFSQVNNSTSIVFSSPLGVLNVLETTSFLRPICP